MPKTTNHNSLFFLMEKALLNFCVIIKSLLVWYRPRLWLDGWISYSALALINPRDRPIIGFINLFNRYRYRLIGIDTHHIGIGIIDIILIYLADNWYLSAIISINRYFLKNWYWYRFDIHCWKSVSARFRIR